MTRQQRRIAAYIRLHRGRMVNRYELRDAVTPNASIQVIGVQVWRIRQAGERRIVSRNGPYGGYTWKGD